MDAKMDLKKAIKKSYYKKREVNYGKGTSKCRTVAQKHVDFLSMLGKERSVKKRNQLLDIASKEQICAIVECIHNILEGNVQNLTSDTIKKLARYKKVMRQLRNEKGGMEMKRNLLKKRGAFLSHLINSVLHIIAKISANGNRRKTAVTVKKKNSKNNNASRKRK